MLRSTSKAAKANIHQYIIEHFDPTGYGYEAATEWLGMAHAIWDVWHKEKAHSQYKGFECFKDWAQGLPSILDTCYYYNRSAVKDLAAILENEELEEDCNDWCKEEYWESERAAEEKLTWLIYRELQEANIGR